MKALSISLLVFSAFVSFAPLSAATLAEEDFEGGSADWVDYDRNPVNWSSSGGHDAGAYISITQNINSDTDPGANFGGFIRMRCAIAPNQLPSQNCSNGIFVGDWWYGLGVQEIRWWFRHDCPDVAGKCVGGLRPYMRMPTPNNNPGASGLPLPKIPANTWAEIVVEIDPQSSDIDDQWGGSNAENILTNIGRLQPGHFIDPADSVIAPGVTIDIDDVRIIGSTPIAATIIVEGVSAPNGPIHPHHNDVNITPYLDDAIPVVILGSDTGQGDPVDLSDDDILTGTVRFARDGATPISLVRNILIDADTIEDARVRFRTSATGIGPTCADSEASIRGDLTTGEIFVGTDSYDDNCNIQCHN